MILDPLLCLQADVMCMSLSGLGLKLACRGGVLGHKEHDEGCTAKWQGCEQGNDCPTEVGGRMLVDSGYVG